MDLDNPPDDPTEEITTWTQARAKAEEKQKQRNDQMQEQQLQALKQERIRKKEQQEELRQERQNRKRSGPNPTELSSSEDLKGNPKNDEEGFKVAGDTPKRCRRALKKKKKRLSSISDENSFQDPTSSPLGNMPSSPISELTDETEDERSNEAGDEMESDRTPETELEEEETMVEEEEERMETKEIPEAEASQTISESYPNPGQKVQVQIEKDPTGWADIVAEAEGAEDDTW